MRWGLLAGPVNLSSRPTAGDIDNAIIRHRRRLDDVRKTRGLHRSARRRRRQKIVAIVGYTNAGKSTLFNHLTRSACLESGALFSTLDPTVRKLELASGKSLLLTDTVGFHFRSACTNRGRVSRDAGRSQ